MKKWTDIFKLKKESTGILFHKVDSEWICTDFGKTIDSDKINMFVMQPLDIHPNGEQFGFAPHGMEVLVMTEQQLEEYFEVIPERNYIDEQRLIEEKFW